MRNLIVASLCVLAATPAMAKPWKIDPAKSTLTFTGTQSDETFTGAFSTFTPEIDFDEANLGSSHINVKVTMGSVTVDGKDRMDAISTKDWFAIKQFPEAEFESSKITKTGEHQFAAQGKLTIRGIAKDVTLPFTLSPDGPATRAEGTVTLARNDYQIGQGRWADDQWVSFPVSVRYIIVAMPK